MCLGGGDTTTTSVSEGKASANVSFNPTITVGSNIGDPAPDTASTFARQLLAAPSVSVALPESHKTNPPADTKTTTLLLYVAVALAARKVLRGNN